MTNLFGPGAFGCARPAASRPTFTPSNLPGDLPDWAQDCSSPLARDGTEWRAAWLNFLIANLRGVVSGSGLPASNLDDAIIARSIQSGGMNFGAATGSANNWTVALNLALASYRAGTVLWLKAPATNTSPTVTVAIDGLAARPLKKADGSNPAIGDLVGGRFYPTIDDGTSIRVIGALASDFSQPMNQRFITAGESFIVPASTLWVEGVGGGGAGGASANGSGGGIAGNMGGGGGAGGFFRKIVSGLTLGSTIAATIGAGGAAASAAPGGAGGTTSFGPHATALGGGGGAWGENTVSSGGAGGTATGGDINIPGASGGFSGPNAGSPTVSDILRVYGRGGQAAGGLSLVDLAATGTSGRGYGSGGSGASGGSGIAGGAGAPGYIWVRW